MWRTDPDQKPLTKQELKRATAEFLRNGGHIRQIENGVMREEDLLVPKHKRPKPSTRYYKPVCEWGDINVTFL